MNNTDEKNRYSHTLNLPQTDFPLRAFAQEKERELLDRWKQNDLYKKLSEQRASDKGSFILHAGPPYANGHIHMGTAANTILKDIICKSHRMMGKYVPFKPGWDCHGLPIERNVEKEHASDDVIEFKTACRDYAQKWINTQREEFKRLGVIADFDSYYSTMSYSYESLTVQAFGDFFEKGYIERKNKTVPWCFHCKTVLAMAEIEYQERKDPSCYIFFPLIDNKNSQLFSELHSQGIDEVGVVVWTTTPWTIPLNYGVVINPQGSYVIVRHENRAYIVGREVVDHVSSALSLHQEVIGELSSEQLLVFSVQHPLIPTRHVSIIADESISLNDGTALMHLAPGCGPEDYLIAVKNNIEVISPITPDGKYSKGIEPLELEGMAITDGQIWVIKQLASSGFLLKAKTSSIRHSYPHCWRCHNGLIYRATKQWFCLLHKNDLIERSLDAVNKMWFVPESGKIRLHSTIANRTEWCLSRQRRWGVPIPALLCKNCDEPYITAAFVKAVAMHVAGEGTEWWDKTSIEAMKEKGIIPHNLSCAQCSSAAFVKEQDILDVWFDSGVMHYAVSHEDSRIPSVANVYIEGSDQHRAWFQSSLLASMILQGRSPMKGIITHGFVVDGAGYKMSKSVGNVISPLDVINKLSADIVRLWVGSIDFTADMAISDDLLKKVSESYRRIRNTIRFLLSNLHDFVYERDAIPAEKLLPLDAYAITMLHDTAETIKKGYETYDISLVFRTVMNFCSTFLSSFYFDITKDRLYVEAAKSLERRSAQTVCYYTLDVLVRLLAPLLSFLSEEAYDHYKEDGKGSIHLKRFPAQGDIFYLTYEKVNCNKAAWDLCLQLRSAVLKALEEKRAQGIIGHSLDAAVTVHFAPSVREKYHELLKTIGASVDSHLDEQFFKEIFIVSHVNESTTPGNDVESELSGVFISVAHAPGTKCLRCWQWNIDTSADELCTRCTKVLARSLV